ncbi:carboxyl-terminal protease [Pseudoalteromonas sp. JBTF-M23]|uniref:Carboxyl-terminal protease n=2 Tax=Pseudoalteromonas caenipelagi TaxID=2726988 RepID=A0A849VM91_9GAMM|nr:carboxyl-terminal protease [Pseudoalteromonas caenipelagi]
MTQDIAQKFDADTAWLELQSTLQQQYAYLDRAGVDKDTLFEVFAPKLIVTQSKQAFADTAQMLLRHFYDPHLNLGPYNAQDYSVFPTGSDIYVNYQNQQFVVVDVKAGSAADVAGIRPNMEIIEIDGMPMHEAVKQVLGREISQLQPEQVNFAANVSLGGYRNTSRKVTAKGKDAEKHYHLAASYEAINAFRDGPMISFRKIDNFGYIRFNNGLGNNKTVDEFKQALAALADTKALIIDLRNTPSGGNTGVAEPILGHFVTHKTAYQRYQTQQVGLPYTHAEMATAYVEPSLPYYDKPFVVLAGHWTGSMGEGMTIGLDAIGAKTVIGAPMADLLGGIKTVQLKHSETWLELGFERLYHVNGSFREDFVPHIRLDTADKDSSGNDPALAKALSVLDRA